MMVKLKKNTKWIICSICFIVFILMAILLVFNKTTPLDNFIYKFITSFKSDSLTVFMKIITSSCNTFFIVIATILLVLFIKNKKTSVFIGINTILNVGINTILKLIFLRDRPIGISLIEQDGYSFPSGHSMMAVAFYGMIIYLIFKSRCDKKIKVIASTLLSLLILFIGVSRIYLGVHYASDVIAGFAISVSYLILFIELIYKRFFYKNKKNS